MPRTPLLGCNDKMRTKQKRSFTIQSEQTIWDIGHPEGGVDRKELIISSFRLRLEGGEFPIHQDHSGTISEKRLAWTTEVQDVDFKDMFPKLIEGFLDEMVQYRTIAMLTLRDAIKHGDPCEIVEAIPYCIPVLSYVLKFYNETSARLVLSFIRTLLMHNEYAGVNLAPYLGKIFMFYNPFVMNSKATQCNLGDQIYYKQYKETCMTEMIEDTMQMAEDKAGNEGMLAAIKLKEAVPSYQSRYLS